MRKALPDCEALTQKAAGPQGERASDCQLMRSAQAGVEPWAWLLRRKLRGAFRRIRRVLSKYSFHAASMTGAEQKATPAQDTVRADQAAFEAGMIVRVKQLPEILKTLDASGALHGCAFVAPMAKFCGQERRIVRRVCRFFDERRWRMLNCKNLALLEDVHCDGSGHRDTTGCDRMCFFFWRTEWLERVDKTDESAGR